MKKLRKKTMVICIICVIAIAFAGLNILWYVHYSNFMDYRSVMDVEEAGGETSYVIRRNGYRYHIKCPDYLDFGGNMAIVEQIGDTTGNEPVLLIWPKLFKKTELGIMLTSKDGYNTPYGFLIDTSGNPIFLDDDSEEYRAEVQQVLLSNKSSVEGLLQAMNDVWDIE